MVNLVALMLIFSIANAVVAIHGNRSLPIGHWARQDVRYVLLNAIGQCAAALVHVIVTFWWAGQSYMAKHSKRTEAGTAVSRKERKSYRVVMARWASRRKTGSLYRKVERTIYDIAHQGKPSRRVIRRRNGVKAAFLSKLATKRAEEKAEAEAAEAASAAKAAKAKLRAQAREAARASARVASRAARKARREAAGRVGKLGAIDEGLRLSVRKYRNSETVVKTTPQQAANGKVVARPPRRSKVAPKVTARAAVVEVAERSWYSWALENARKNRDIALQLDLELQRCARLERAHGCIGLMADEAIEFEAQVKADRAQARAAQAWAREGRRAVAMGMANPIVTKRSGMVAHATILPVLAEHLGVSPVLAIIGILATVAILALVKFIKGQATTTGSPELAPSEQVQVEPSLASSYSEGVGEIAGIGGFDPDVYDEFLSGGHGCPEDQSEKEWLAKERANQELHDYYSLALLPISMGPMGLGIDPMLVTVILAVAWLISKISPSFGGFFFTLFAGAFGFAAATVTGKEDDSDLDQEERMIERTWIAMVTASELVKTTKQDLEGSFRTDKVRAKLYELLARRSAILMVEVLLGKGMSLTRTYEEMFYWPRLNPDNRKQIYRTHIDSMAPDAQKSRDLELKLKEKYGISLFGDNAASLEDYKHSLHHIHRTPGSAATIEMHDIIERALGSMAENGDLRAVTTGELAKAWVTLNLIQTNFASEVMFLNPAGRDSAFKMVNALSKTSFNQVRVSWQEELDECEEPFPRPEPTSVPTDIFLLYKDVTPLTTEDEDGYDGFDLGSMAYRVREFTDTTKAAKAQKYISQYFAPNLLGGQVIDFARTYRVGKRSFYLKSLADSVVVLKPASGESILGSELADKLANKVYDGVVLVSRRFMTLVLPSHAQEIANGKLDGKLLIGRAYGFEFMIKGGFVIMPPEFMNPTGKEMIAYGSKNEICPTWVDDRFTVIINSGVPKSDKGACTDTQTLINGFDLKSHHVQRIFTKVKDDAVIWLKDRLDDVRKGKIQMGELASDILDFMGHDSEDKASDEVTTQLHESSRLKEIIHAMARVAGNGISLPQLVAPIMNQMTNQGMDPGRTRLPLAMFMETVNGVIKYCKIAYSIYPQVHYGLVMEKTMEALGLQMSPEQCSLMNGYKNPMTEEQLRELKEEHLESYGLSYEEKRNIFCNPADYQRIVELHGTPLVAMFRNPSTFTSGAWGQLVPMASVPVGCYWINPTPEAFTWFFANQDGADLDDRMVMVVGELAISCILYHEGEKKKLIAEKILPFKEEGSIKAKVVRAFIKAQTSFLLREDLEVCLDAKVKLTEGHRSMIKELTGDTSLNILRDMVTTAPIKVGSYSYKETMTAMNLAKDAFNGKRPLNEGSALAKTAQTIRYLELMKGTTGTAANVQMLMGAITQSLVHFGEGIDLDAKIKSISKVGQQELRGVLSAKELEVLGDLTYRDLMFFIKSEMLSDVIDADTQGQNVPQAAEVMEMIWGVSMYLGIALFAEELPNIKSTGHGHSINFNMISLDRMKFYFPGWLMKRAIGAFAAPFAGQSHMLQHGESADPKKVNLRHFAFEHTKVDGATSWLFEIFEDYMDQVLGIAYDEIQTSLNDSETPAWSALKLGLQAFGHQVQKAAALCSKLNKMRMDGISAVHRMELEPKRRRAALTGVEQSWLANWNATLPTEEGKLTFALWTLTKLVEGAERLKVESTFADRESFVSSSRRSYGSIAVKGLPTHALYVGNLLDSSGKPLTNSNGLPQGPWLYTLMALNAIANSPAVAKVNVSFSFADKYKDLKEWHYGVVNQKPGFTIEDRPVGSKTPMTTRDSFGRHNLESEVMETIQSEVVNKSLAEVLVSGVLSVSEGDFTGKLNLNRKGNDLINKSYSSWCDSVATNDRNIEEFIKANNLHDYLVTDIEVEIDKANMVKPYGHPTFNLHLKYTGPNRPLQNFDFSTLIEKLDSAVVEEVSHEAELTYGPNYETEYHYTYAMKDVTGNDIGRDDFLKGTILGKLWNV